LTSQIERITIENKAWFFGEDLIVAVFERLGKEELAELVTLGGAETDIVILNFDEAAVEDFTFGGEGHTNESVWSDRSEGNG